MQHFMALSNIIGLIRNILGLECNILGYVPGCGGPGLDGGVGLEDGPCLASERVLG